MVNQAKVTELIGQGTLQNMSGLGTLPHWSDTLQGLVLIVSLLLTYIQCVHGSVVKHYNAPSSTSPISLGKKTND